MIKDRRPIYNARGERIFDVVKTDKKIYLETYHKGEIRRITLAEEIYQIYLVLSPCERITMFEQMKNLMTNEMSLA